MADDPKEVTKVERFNKNGIRILDPVNQNHMRKPFRCLPDEHRWKETGMEASQYGVGTVITSKCIRCGDTMTEESD